jgi:uncharacterized protein YbaR (Trm112 family)
MALDPRLLEILVCPRSRAPLVYFEAEEFLFCPESRLRYRIEDGVPVMLVEEAEEVDEGTARELVAAARLRGTTGRPV